MYCCILILINLIQDHCQTYQKKQLAKHNYKKLDHCIMQFRDLIGLAAMVYEPLYHGQEKASIKIVLAKRNQQDIAIFLDCF